MQCGKKRQAIIRKKKEEANFRESNPSEHQNCSNDQNLPNKTTKIFKTLPLERCYQLEDGL